MNNGLIKNNNLSSNGGNGLDFGGGVFVTQESTFTISGGIITGNNANMGGGVFIDRTSSFNQTGGIIKDNKSFLFPAYDNIYVSGLND